MMVEREEVLANKKLNPVDSIHSVCSRNCYIFGDVSYESSTATEEQDCKQQDVQKYPAKDEDSHGRYFQAR